MPRPHSIALVGAADRSMWSRATFTNPTTLKFDGDVHPMARHRDILCGTGGKLALGPLLRALDVNPLWVHGSRIEALGGLAIARTA